MIQSVRSIPPWEFLKKALPDSQIFDFDFDAFCSLAKADNTNTSRRGVRGVASTDAKDLQDEEVVQKGLDLRYFLKHGYFNNDHKPGFANKVGQPTVALIKRVKDDDGADVVGLWTVGYLWPKGTHKGADEIWELGKALESADSDRHLSFSIQGKVLQREDKRILKAWVQDIAITPAPVNTKTWLEVFTDLSKGLNVQQSDVEDIRKSINSATFLNDSIIEEPWIESGKSLTSLSPMVKQDLEQRLKRNGYENKLFDPETDEDEVSKAVRYSYQYFKSRGHNERMARASALVAVARSIVV